MMNNVLFKNPYKFRVPSVCGYEYFWNVKHFHVKSYSRNSVVKYVCRNAALYTEYVPAV